MRYIKMGMFGMTKLRAFKDMLKKITKLLHQDTYLTNYKLNYEKLLIYRFKEIYNER